MHYFGADNSNNSIVSIKLTSLMQKKKEQRRPSFELFHTSLSVESKSNNASQLVGTVGVSEQSISRKNGLKSKSQSSEKKMGNESKRTTSKSLKSCRSIQFRKTNQFQTFIYEKEQSEDSIVE
jgi:hypothetical protein